MRKPFPLLLTLVLGLPAMAQPATIAVKTTIQAAVDAAKPGDTIVVPPGIYRETVTVSKDNLTIVGSVAAVLDGRGLPGTTGIRVGSSTTNGRLRGFTLRGLTIRNYSRTGIRLTRVDDFDVSHGRYIDNEEYAIFPVLSSDGSIAFNEVSGCEDSGIYVGQSHDVAVEHNYTHDCRVGIEIENAAGIDIVNNEVTDNSIGLLVFVLPGLSIPATSDVHVERNNFDKNNRPMLPAAPDEVALPSGIGILNVGADHFVATQNLALHNASAGIAVIRLPPNLAALDPRVDPFPDNNLIADNVVLQNGAHPDLLLGLLPGADLLWDGTGAGNRWSRNIFKSQFPKSLPGGP